MNLDGWPRTDLDLLAYANALLGVEVEARSITLTDSHILKVLMKRP